MQLSETVRLYLTKEQYMLVSEMMTTYIATVNRLVADAVDGRSIAKLTSKDVDANLPSALRCQCAQDARSVFKRYQKACREADRRKARHSSQGKAVKQVTVPILRRPCCFVNSQNFRVRGADIEFPVMMDGRSKRIAVRTRMTERQKALFCDAKLGTMRIVYKGRMIVAQIVYEMPEQDTSDGEGCVMGIDLGIKCPAVSRCSDGSVKFYGNGRHNKALRRHYAAKRKALQKAKHQEALARINNKEQRIMKDIDHKLSREIIKTAEKHHVKVIKMERLSNIRTTTRTSRKNNSSLHTWSFYRLAQFIEYKARLAGIEVLYVNPAYTSQTCPNCGKRHHADDRNFVCECGFRTHRDIVGAWNICSSTEYVGGSDARHAA